MKGYKNGVQKKKGQFSFYFLLSRVKSLIHGRRRKVLMSTPFIAPVLRQLSSQQTFLAQKLLKIKTLIGYRPTSNSAKGWLFCH